MKRVMTLNTMTKVHEELEAMGSSVIDKDFTTIILTSIPPSYRTLLHSISHSANLSSKSLNPNNLMWIILKEARQRELTNQSSKSGDAALYAKKGKG